jgi:hypothetical protein
MSFWSKLFPCRGCEARDAELERVQKSLRWLEGQVENQNKRLVEIADPHAEERVVQADRLGRKPITPPRRADPDAGLRLPGTEPAPLPDWEVDEGT